MKAIGFAIGLALQLVFVASVRAEPIDLAVQPCLRSEVTAIRRAVQVELGPLAAPGAAAVQVVVACDGDILVVSVVDPVRGALRFRIDPSGIPATARARLIALTISEAVEASHIELAPAPVVGSSPFSSGSRPLVPMHEAARSRSEHRLPLMTWTCRPSMDSPPRAASARRRPPSALESPRCGRSAITPPCLATSWPRAASRR